MSGAGNFLEKYQYETEYFGFSPLALVDGIINAANDYVFEAVKGLEKSLIESEFGKGFSNSQRVDAQTGDGNPNNDKNNEDIIRKGCSNALLLLQNAVDLSFDQFELYVLNNNLRIPNYIRIPGDQRHLIEEKGVSSELDTKLDEEISHLYSRLIAAKYFQSQLKHEKEHLTHAMTQVELGIKNANTMKKICGSADIPILSEHVSFACNEAKELSGLLCDGLKENTFNVDQMIERDANASGPDQVASGVGALLSGPNFANISKTFKGIHKKGLITKNLEDLKIVNDIEFI
eukprot:Nk52_evm1s1962 gene=Nk52_evmTU1s1962